MRRIPRTRLCLALLGVVATATIGLTLVDLRSTTDADTTAVAADTTTAPDAVASTDSGTEAAANADPQAGLDAAADADRAVVAVGYDADGDLVRMADSADPDGNPEYTLRVADLANWLATRGYAA